MRLHRKLAEQLVCPRLRMSGPRISALAKAARRDADTSGVGRVQGVTPCKCLLAPTRGFVLVTRAHDEPGRGRLLCKGAPQAQQATEGRDRATGGDASPGMNNRRFGWSTSADRVADSPRGAPPVRTEFLLLGAVSLRLPFLLSCSSTSPSIPLSSLNSRRHQ